MRAKATLAAALFVLALAAARGAAPALSLGWYGGGACDDAAAQNPGDPDGCRYGARERACANGVDDDSDEAADAADADCGGYCGDGACTGGETPRSCDSDCGCPPWSLLDPSTWTCGGRCAPSELDLDGDCAADFRPWGHACADGVDDDGDGATDCADPDCERAFPACLGGYCGDGVCGTGESWCVQDCGGCLLAESAGICANGADDDCDGKIDCLDTDCRGSCSLLPATDFRPTVISGASSLQAPPQNSPLTLIQELASDLIGSEPAMIPGGSVLAGSNPTPSSNSNLPTQSSCGAPSPLYYSYGPLRNCHDSANLFCDQNEGFLWDLRVVQCAGDVMNVPQHHTINLFRSDIATNEWCMIDPQGGYSCCFTDYACSVDDVSLAKGTEGGTCAQSLCPDQYLGDGDGGCRVLPEGARATSDLREALMCAEKKDMNNGECLSCCGELMQDAKGRWLDTWAKSCDDTDNYTNQLQMLSDICVAGCSADPNQLENTLKNLPEDVEKAARYQMQDLGI